ncbi:FtsK/SpoIIIE domain-containing protein [Streptomyces sp. NPDC002574]|uniref:FtsK/SpoIIIE domain-containing protein n=1 Tax=Streptomyces sp. NPDC002574 TaxID=3364652 RepID=UPI003699C34F
MRLTVTVVDPDPRTGRAADIVIDTDPGVPVGELAGELSRAVRGAAPADDPPVLYAGADPLPAEQAVAAAGLRSGGLLALGTPLDVPRAGQEPEGVVELRAIGGTGAGSVFRLPPGNFDIGSAATARVRLPAGDLPESAAHLVIAVNGSVLVRAAHGESLRLDDTELTGDGEWRDWPVAGVLTCGPVLLERTAPTAPDAAVVPSADGTGLDYNRPPRLLPPTPKNRFRLPRPPSKQARNRLQLPMIFAPLVMSGAMTALTGNSRMLLFGLLSPVMALVNQLTAKRRGKETYAEQLAVYKETKAELDQEVEEAVLAEQAARRAACPDPATALLIAAGPRRRLWERRWRDDDFLLLRLGVADRPAWVELEDPAEAEHRRRVTRTTHAVPVAVSLREAGVVGLAADVRASDAALRVGGAPAEGSGADVMASLARWLVAQAAVLHSPSDLRIYVLSGSAGADRWSWVHWLPHCAPQGEDTVSLVGSGAESLGRRVAELSALIAARKTAGRGAPRGGAAGEPDVLVVLDGARRLRALPGVIQILRDGPEVGVYALCLDDEERLLPEECQAVAVAGVGGLWIRQAGVEPVTGVLMDAPEPAWFTGVARALAPVRDVGDDAEEGLLPTSARLLDVLGLEPPTAEAVAAAWAVSARSTRAVLGEGVDGPFAVDLKADGPHGLIAGTTGSGKSELLQSLVASLAVANRPDELNFVLVDYKGGSAFAECEDLPHTVGMVTDLDTHLVERALTSLGAELRRREHILADAGAKDIDDYTDKRARRPELGPMPRLVLVIDEFASMVRELPDFVSGLVNIAQRGRSLGIHLILATQRPSGAVTADIRANTNLRIALRTTDPSESRDIIDAPDAGQLSPRTPGRAYARLGHAVLLPFQTGRIGGRRPDLTTTAEDDHPAPLLTELHWEELGDPPPARRKDGEQRAVQTVTDLAVLVQGIGAAAELLAIPEPRRPWLPPLPDSYALPEGSGPSYDAEGRLTPVTFGQVDVPAEQARTDLVFDFDEMGHLHLIGAPRSGRSQALRTLAAAVARDHSTADVHIYGLDCGNGALQALAELPHCGAVVDRGQIERVVRLLNRLVAELNSRRAQLGRGGLADLTELRRRRSPIRRPPHLLLLVDRFEAFERDFGTYDQGSVMEKMLLLLREGAAVGIHLVLTGDRILTSSRFVSTTEDKLVLRLNDRNDYSAVGVPYREIPAELPAGRAIRLKDTCSVQIALIDPDPSGAAQAAALDRIAKLTAERDRAVPAQLRPFRVDVLPDRFSFEDALARVPEGASPLWAMVGVGGDELSAVGTDLAAVPTFVIAGPPRSGRSTVLLTMARSLLARGNKLVVVAPRPSPLRSLAGRPGVVDVLTDPDVALADFRKALHGVDSPTGAILLDDADMLAHSEIDSDLTTFARGAAGDGWGLIAAGNNEAFLSSMSGWQVALRRNRCGAILAPRNLSDGEPVGARLPHGLLGADPEPGKAYLHLGDGKYVTVRVPEPGGTR